MHDTMRATRYTFVGNMIRRLSFGVLLVVTISTATSQTLLLSDWNTLSSMRTVRDVDVDGNNRLWAATTGGVFAYSLDSKTAVEHRNINALQTLDTRTILCANDRNEVYVGGGDGSVDIFTSNDEWVNVTDIRRATQYPRRGVTDLVQKGNTLFIATEFGLLSYDLDRRQFIETVDRIGSLQEKTPVNAITIFRDSLWLATDSGVAVASLSETSLRQPGVWTILNAQNGLTKNRIAFIASTSAGVYCASDTSLYAITDGTCTRIRTTLYPITNVSSSLDTLYWSSVSGIETLKGRKQITWSGGFMAHAAFVANGKPYLAGFIERIGIDLWDYSTRSTIELNGPVSNKFARMAIDTRGRLWVATDVEPPKSGEGVCAYDGTTWTSLTMRTTPALHTNSCYRVSALSDGTVLIGTWGRGATRISYEGADVELTHYLPGSNAVQGIAIDSTYALIADAQLDRNGTLWMVNEQSVNQLFVQVPENGTAVGHSNCTDSRATNFRSMVIDAAGNKWAGSTTGSGLVVWNAKGTTDRADDVCNVVRSSNSQLTDNIITALAIDKNGALWIGTPRGVCVMGVPTSVTNTNIPYVRRVTLLASSIVNDIFIDALNNKWIATQTGVFVLNEDGTEVISQITKSNAPLLDENVRCVVVDGTSGIAYLGTSAGCTTVRTSSLAPAAEYQLSIRPQPFRVHTDNEVVIDGLAPDSDIRILTASGYLVNALQVRGRQAIWDGRDTEGKPVPPGVYIVHTTSASSKQSAVTKIAVQR